MEKDEKTINDYDEEEDEPTCRRTSNIPEDHILKVIWQSGMEYHNFSRIIGQLFIYHLLLKMKKEYHKMDVDGDGDISRSELAILLKSMKRKLGMSENTITKLVNQTDLDGDGTIDFNEFLNLIENVETKKALHKALIQRAGIRKAFERYDKDGKGFLTRHEFKRALEDKYEAVLAQTQVDALMNRVDTDKSGKIEYDEFIKTFSYFPVT